MTLKKDYEISIWEQKENEEIKLGVIGSNEMSSLGRAQKPILTRNTNGTKKLEFYLFYEYIDKIDGIIRRNPYCSLLSNGRKIKLKWKDKWYEFIITNIVEDSDNKKITYTAQDAYIIELSRRGFNIELSTELENNQGTIYELTNSVLENTDWILDEENSIVSPQTTDEVLIKLKTVDKIVTKKKTFLDSSGVLSIEEVVLEIPKNSIIYSFYSLINNEDEFFQFYYLPEEKDYSFDEENFIQNCPLYLIDNYEYKNGAPQNTEIIETMNRRGKKLIRSQKTQYNNILQTYVKTYQEDDKEILGYTKTEYFSDDFVTNLITNNTDFVAPIGWYGITNNTNLEIYNYPSAETALGLLKDESDVEPISYLQINTDQLNDWIFYNTGPNDNKDIIDSLFDGKQFVVRLKYKYNKNKEITSQLKTLPYNKTNKQLETGFVVNLCSYEYDDNGKPKILKTLLSTKLSGNGDNVFKKDGSYWTAICKCSSDYTKEELENMSLGLFFKFSKTKESNLKEKDLKKYYFYFEDCQFFELKEKEDDNDNGRDYYLPEETPESESKIRYKYFLAEQEFDSEEQITFLYNGYKQKNYNKVYYENYPQIKTVEKKESNIFNLIQTFCETFDCWADFIVEHDSLGYIKKDSNGNLVKKIQYKPYIGKENWSGYRRGINLKKVTRNIDSTQITTKTIVKPNSNEFAPNGFCTIAYSKENPSKESFIYDFSHYIFKGLIDSDKIHEELYGDKGLYKELKEINTNIEKLTEERVAVSKSLIHNEKEKEIYSALVSELSSSISEAKKDFRTYSGITYASFLDKKESKQKQILELAGVNSTFVKIYSETNKLKKANEKHKQISENYKADLKKYKELKQKIANITEEKECLILNFETKYSNYIQEGVWISEEFIDHDLYYLEAKNIANTSAMPKISYNIDVIDISSLEEFFNYDIDIGDKTYIIDPEFFGYLNEFEIKTPKKQEVVITELVEDLENPENNRTTVQSYKTQFDDLFQRITATTQQLQLSEGRYNRSANAFSPQGLNSELIVSSLNENKFSLKNNTVEWNSNGLETINALNKHEFIKIHNGSIYLTNDGGNSWNTAISGKGINASYIYAGQLDAGKINIVSELKTNEDQELQYALTMDKDGLSMFSFENDSKFTRVRLGKIENTVEGSEELYGLQLYNSKGEETFSTDSNGDITIAGTIHAKDGFFNGSINAKEGYIGGWVIGENDLSHRSGQEFDAIIATEELTQNYSVNGVSNNDWRLLFGISGDMGNFGINSKGNLYANGVDIKDGNISFGDLFKITSYGGKAEAVRYNLNINISPENEDKNVVIESEERIIGIREKLKDKDGNLILDSSGNTIWNWTTAIGDLSKVTLNGAESFADMGLEGYGICTDHGFFKGTIIAGTGEIGGWKIEEDHLVRAVEVEDNSITKGMIFGTTKIEQPEIGEEVYTFSLAIKNTQESDQKTIIINDNNYINFSQEFSIKELFENFNLEDPSIQIENISILEKEFSTSHSSYLNVSSIKLTRQEDKITLELTEEAKKTIGNYFQIFDEPIEAYLIFSLKTNEIKTFTQTVKDGFNIPKDFIESKKSNKFLYYVFYQLISRIPFNNINIFEFPQDISYLISLKQQIKKYSEKYIQYLANQETNFIQFYNDSVLNYGVNEKGQTMALLSSKSLDKEDYIDVFSEIETSPFKLYITSDGFSEKQLSSIFSIPNFSNESLWKLGIENNFVGGLETLFIGFQRTKEEPVLWKFRTNNSYFGDPKTYSFFFEGDKSKEAKCNLGTEENSWENLYLSGEIKGGKTWLNQVYPIGSIYMSVNEIDPGTLFGGTWERWGKGRVPVGVDDSGTFSTVDDTGGAASTSYTPKGTISGTVENTTLTVEQIPSHSHTFLRATGTAASGTSKATANSNGDPLSGIIGNTGGGKPHNHDFSGSFSGTKANISTLQPYITCYMWKRIA